MPYKYTKALDLLDTSTKFLLNTFHVWVKVLMFQIGEWKREKQRPSARASDDNMFGPAPYPYFGCSTISQI